MIFPKFKVTLSTLTDAIAAGCDTVQLKYNGRLVRVEVSRGMTWVYDHRDETIDLPIKLPEPVCGTFLGNLVLAGTHIVLWDCLRVCGTPDGEMNVSHMDVSHLPYRQRYALLVAQVRMMKSKLVTCVVNQSIKTAGVMWIQHLPHTCGLVFRNSMAPADGVVRVARKYDGVVEELV